MNPLFCDEDVGKGVPTSLDAVNFEAKALVSLGWGGKPDTWWLEQVGTKGWLVFSCNKKMLEVPSEREAIIRHKVGIIFMTNGEEYPHVMLLALLRNWDTIRLLDETTVRPFARFLHPARKGLLLKYKQFSL